MPDACDKVSEHTRNNITKRQRLPSWFRIRLQSNERSAQVRTLIRGFKLHTVCQSAACPNQTTCWNTGTVTFLILGNLCTRSCRFCNVPKGVPTQVDDGEPIRVAQVAAALGLKYVVVTSVTRDDLNDGGAGSFAATIHAIRMYSPHSIIETLIPDFQGSTNALSLHLNAKPDVLSHNIETVPSLYETARPQASYERSLQVLSYASERGFATKSGIMVGLGEKMNEIIEVMRDLRTVGCSVLTIGQYLQPGRRYLPVVAFYHPDDFEYLRTVALSLGFRKVESGPMVRSSYRAGSWLERGDR
jgi:lipoic acid synthetase